MPKKIPQRMCVTCRQMKPKKELIRLVLNQQGQVSLDPTGKLPGRGAYVCKDRQCLEEAVRTNKIDRGLKHKVSQDIIAALVAEMEALTHEPDRKYEEQ